MGNIWINGSPEGVTHPDSKLTSRDDQCTALLRMIEQDRLGDGLMMARDLTERFPGHGLGWKFLGALLWGEGRTEDALAAMQTSVGLLAHDAEAHKNLGTALVQLKRFDAAAPHLRRATVIDPSLAEPHYQLAMIDLQAGRFVAAQANLRSGLALRGRLPAHRNRTTQVGRKIDANRVLPAHADGGRNPMYSKDG
jgi:Flp pilus assembly protein TadD